jgi:hypothetical protein
MDGSVLFRNSERPEEWIQDTARAADAFIRGVKAGEFDHLLVSQPRYAVQNRGAVWVIHDNESHADVSWQVLEQTAEAMCAILNESLREAAS